jgi:hypothetical protein
MCLWIDSTKRNELPDHRNALIGERDALLVTRARSEAALADRLEETHREIGRLSTVIGEQDLSRHARHRFRTLRGGASHAPRRR